MFTEKLSNNDSKRSIDLNIIDWNENFLAQARTRHEGIFEKGSRGSIAPNFLDSQYCNKLKRLVLIVSASRSGSSWLTEILRGNSNFASIPGELDPLLSLLIPAKHRVLIPDYSDSLDAGDVTCNLLERMSLLLCWMTGNRKLRTDRWYLSKREEYDMAMRILWQWPRINIDDSRLLRTISLFTNNLNKKWSPTSVTLNLVKVLKEFHKLDINPYYYDIHYSRITKAFPDEKLPCGPPCSFGVIEEPPFISFVPWVSATPEERTEKPLILKSPSNSYRLDFFRRLFPNAEIVLVHVVRNAISSIKGLMCGWKHHGFFKHLLNSNSLNIGGYSDSSLPWTRRWWKFDLPPGWSEYTDQPLVKVCSFQWLSANNCILQWARKHSSEITYAQVRYESMIKDIRAELSKLCLAIGVSPDIGLLRAIQTNPVVMSSRGLPEELMKSLRRNANSEQYSADIVDLETQIREARHGI